MMYVNNQNDLINAYSFFPINVFQNWINIKIGLINKRLK